MVVCDVHPGRCSHELIQNVAAALSGGVVAILGGLLAVAIGFLMIPVLSGKKQKETVAEDSLAHSK